LLLDGDGFPIADATDGGSEDMYVKRGNPKSARGKKTRKAKGPEAITDPRPRTPGHGATRRKMKGTVPLPTTRSGNHGATSKSGEKEPTLTLTPRSKTGRLQRAIENAETRFKEDKVFINLHKNVLLQIRKKLVGPANICGHSFANGGKKCSDGNIKQEWHRRSICGEQARWVTLGLAVPTPGRKSCNSNIGLRG